MEELNSLNKLNSLNSLNKLGGQGSGSQQDIGIEELLYVAQSKGGRLAEVANELSGRGTRSILSTIGNKFKTTFNDFVDIISIPGQVVAGVISKDFTVAEAIKENKRVSDAIFGDTNLFGKDGTPTTMQKIGDFVVRLPVDIITDPLTYLTFGASSTRGILGKMGFGGNTKVSLGKEAAAKLGKTLDDGEVISRTLSDYGQDVMSFQKKYANALNVGSKEANLAVKSSKEELIKSGVDKSILDAVQKNTKALLRETIDAKFDVPLAQKVMSNIMSKNPALVETLIDKGGIKFAGKTILDAQRVGKIAGVIPGMKWIDEVSLPLRNSVLAKFDTGLMKVGSDYVRLPEHVVTMRQQLKNISESMNVDLLKNLDDIQRTANLNESEIDILVNSISNKIPPADMRLQNAYYKLLGIKEGGLDLLRKAGIPVSLMDNHVGLISVPNDSRFIRGNSMFGKEVGSQMRASYIAAVPLQEVGAVQKMDEVKKVIEGLGGKSDEAVDAVTLEAKKYKSAEEFVKAQPKVYHAGTPDIKEVDLNKTNFSKTFYVSDKADYAKSFGGNKSVVNEMVLDPKANLVDMRKPSEELVSQIDQMTRGRTTGKIQNITKPDGTILGLPEVVDRTDFGSFSQKQVIQGIRDGKAYFAELPEIKKVLKKLGYDGQITSEVPYAKNIGVWNKDVIKTKSQLEEIFNKSQKTTTKSQFPDLLEKINNARTVEDVTTAIGEKRDSIIKELTKDGKMSLENAVKDSRIVKLDELQSLTKDLKTEGRKVGKLEQQGLTLKNTDEEIRNIISEADNKISKLNISKKNFEDDIADISDKISQAMSEKVTGNFNSFLKSLPPESRTNAKVIMQRIEEYVGKADIEKLKANVLESKSKEQLAKEVVGISYEDALDIASKILKDESMMPVDIENLNKFIKETLQEKLNKTTRIGGKKEVSVISDIDKNKIAKLYEQSGAIKYKMVREKMDENALSKLIEVLKDEYTKDPGGLRRFVESLIGKESKLNDVISLIDETRLNAQKKIGLLPDEEMYFVDNADKVYKRVATTAQELHASGIEGFDKNLLTAFTTREMQNIRQSLGHEFAQGLVRNFGRWSDEAPDSWVTMSSSLVNDEAKAIAQGFVRGDGVEMKFHPAVAKMFDEMVTGLGGGDEVTKEFMKSYDKLQSYYKSYLTTVFPMFHGRNAISNVLLNFLDMGFSVFDPRKHFTAINLIKDDRQINKLMRLSMGTGDEAVKASQELLALKDKTVFTDVTGYRWKLGELRDVIRKNDIAFNPNITGSLDVRNDYKGLSDFYMTGKTNKEIAKARLNPLNADQFAPTRFGRDVLGRTIEEQSRLVNFMKNLMDTGDVTHAAKRTKQFLFDYSNLTKFEKDIMRRIMPFYSFTRKNLELQAKTLMTAPGKIASEIKMVSSLGSFINGEGMTEEERKLLPKWMQNNLNIKRRREDGKYEIVSGFGTPIEQPFQQFQAQSLLGSLSPLIKIPIEQMTGYNMFRGKMTSDVTDAKDFRDAPEAIKDFIGYQEWKGKDKSGKEYTVHRALRPDNMQLIMSMPYSRFISTMSSITDKDVTSELRLLQSVTGVTARSFDEEQLREQEARELLKDLEKILRDSGIRGEFKRGYNRKDTTTIEN